MKKHEKFKYRAKACLDDCRSFLLKAHERRTYRDWPITKQFHLASLCTAAFFLMTGLLSMNTYATEGNDIRDPRFSPDGKSIVFDWCSPDYPDRCRIHVYNLETGDLSYYLPPPGQTWMQAYYADKGDKLVFVTRPAGDGDRDQFNQRNEIFPKAQIAVMNADGSNVRVLTNTPFYKGMPAFSHLGKRIIFAQAEKIRDSGKTVAAFWDLWELNLETGELGLFAGHFQFYQMGLSTYFPDDQRVLVNGGLPFSQVGSSGNLASSIDEYGRRYRRNSVFKVSRGQARLDAPLLSDFSSTRNASMDGNETLFVEADGGLKEGLRFRRITPKGQEGSWGFPPHNQDQVNILGGGISHDGRYFVVAFFDGPLKRKNGRLTVLDTSSGTWRDIALPNEAKQINR